MQTEKYHFCMINNDTSLTAYFFPPFVLTNYYLSKKKKCLLQAVKDNWSTMQPYLQESNHNWDPGKHSWHYGKTDVVLGRNFRCFLWGRCTDKSAWEIRTKVCDPARRFKRQENCTEPETMVLKCWDCKKTEDEFPVSFLSWSSTGNTIPHLTSGTLAIHPHRCKSFPSVSGVSCKKGIWKRKEYLKLGNIFFCEHPEDIWA